MRGFLWKGVALALAVGPAGAGQAATVTGSGTASMTLATTCVIWANSPTTLAFGSQAPTGTQISQTDASFTGSGIQCTNGGSANVYATSANASGSQFRLKSGSNYLNYNIYQDTSRSTAWPQSSSASGAGVTGSGSSQSYPIYGRIPAQSYPGAGTYSDTITLNVTY